MLKKSNLLVQPDPTDVGEREAEKEFYFFDLGQESIIKLAGNINLKLATIRINHLVRGNNTTQMSGLGFQSRSQSIFPDSLWDITFTIQGLSPRRGARKAMETRAGQSKKCWPCRVLTLSVTVAIIRAFGTRRAVLVFFMRVTEKAGIEI